jgi:predicted metal-dependent hydrolase
MLVSGMLDCADLKRILGSVPAQRYSRKPFPAYRYTPGENPHPVIDADGHSFGQTHEPVVFDVQNWTQSPDFRYGIDLINHGFFWEAHEVLEGIWHHLGRHSGEARFIQALILLAVACLHQRRGRESAVRKVSQKGLNRLVGIETHYFGIPVLVISSYLQLLKDGQHIKPDIRLMV